MKKTFFLFLILTCPALSAVHAAPNQKPCEITEQALLYELSARGQQRTVEDHVRTAKIYTSISRRGCPGNSETYKQYSKASIEAARAMAEISDLNRQNKLYYENMINKAAVKNF
jgi:hypothetical protein